MNYNHKETNYILNKLSLEINKSKIEILNRIPDDIIENETILLHKIKYHLINLDFSKAQQLLDDYKLRNNQNSGYCSILQVNITKTKNFYDAYKIHHTNNNMYLINKLKNNYWEYFINTTPCIHDKSGKTMVRSCYKCQ